MPGRRSFRSPALVVLTAALAVTASMAGAGPSFAEERAVVEAPAVPGQFLVKFRQGTPASERAAAVRRHGGRLVSGVPSLGIVSAEFAEVRAGTLGRGSVMAAVQRERNVEFVEPNYLYTTTFTPNDPALGQQWAWSRIAASSAWDVTRGSSSTVVAVVDTGVQRTHPDLDAKIVAGHDFVQGDSAPDDGHGHGTHVAGTVGAETNNGTGGAGTCPNCRIMPVRVLDNNGTGTLTSVANGITWAADNGADVINLSLGGPGSPTLQSAVDYAWNRGSFLACAAGNESTSSTSNAYPGAYENCFAVASTTGSDARSSFSNHGSWVDVAAPGTSIYSTWASSGYNTMSGTSMATPHVAGLAGLLASQGLTNSTARQRICDTADDIAGTGTYWACGRIDAEAAVSGSPPPPPPPPPSILVNGGFESGTSPWVQSSRRDYQLIRTNRPRTGSYSASLGGYNNAVDSVYQTVTIPADGTLTYWWYMTSAEGMSRARDYLRVRLYDSSGAWVATLQRRTNRAARGAWYRDSISVAGHAGRTLRVHFTATTNSSLVTRFFIDDVAV